MVWMSRWLCQVRYAVSPAPVQRPSKHPIPRRAIAMPSTEEYRFDSFDGANMDQLSVRSGQAAACGRTDLPLSETETGDRARPLAQGETDSAEAEDHQQPCARLGYGSGHFLS